MANFDPDAYIAATEPTPAFDPDAYLKDTAPTSNQEVPVVQPSQIAPSQSRESTRPSVSLPSLTNMLFGGGGETVQHAQEAAGDIARGIPSMVTQAAKGAIDLAKFQVGTPQQQTEAIGDIVGQSVQQAKQIVSDVQSPLGSRESFRGIAQLGMMALPAAGELSGLLHPEVAKPPIQQIPVAREAVPEQLQPQIGEPNAVQEPSTGEILQRQPQETGGAGSERVGVEPSVQGQETPETRQGIEAQPQEVAPTVPQPEPTAETPTTVGKVTPQGQAEPIVAYHGSRSEFETFRHTTGDVGFHFGSPEQADWRVGDEGTVKPYILDIKNPLRLEDKGGWYGEDVVKMVNEKIGSKLPISASTSTIREAIQKAGYDGIVYKNKFELPEGVAPSEGQDSYIAFKSSQIKPAPVSTEGQAPSVAKPPISTKNAYTEAQRAERGFPEAEQAAKRDFGTVWDEAAAQAEQDPNVGRRLVDELNNKPRPISDTENAQLLRTQIAAQTEHSSAVEAVNNAKTPEDLTAARSRLELARNDLQNVYDATKRAGTKSGQALAARQMLAKEDYTLASMEARRRAANSGSPLNEKQLSEVSALHEKISDLQSKLDAHDLAQKFNTEFNRLVNEAKKDARASKATTKFTDFMDRKANEARARIVERRGRLTTGFDPSSITDEAIIGASHIAKGITKFADWSVKMVDEFGDAIRPFLKDIWEKAKAFHAETGKEYGEKALARYKTYLSRQTEQIKGKLEAGDFTKAERQRTKLDAEAFAMRANLQRLKNEFERGVAKEAYQNKSPVQKFWDHFVGVERAMKLSGPEVFGKLGVAAAAREAGLAPAESAVGYGVSKVFPRFAAGTKFAVDLPTVIRAELKAKAALFTKGIQDAAQNVKGKETELDAISGTKIRPDFWYNRIGQMHAAIKAPIKRAEFTRSLEQRMNVAVKSGEDIHHPEVMTRLANEAVMDANRSIFQQNTVVSSFFSMLDRQIPAAGRAARFLFPVVKIPVNLFKEVLTYHAGAPVAIARIGHAYLKGVETLPVPQREAIIRQLTKGSVGGAALLWGYFNSDKVRKFFDNAPQWFNHTPIAMVLNEGSYLKKLQGTSADKKQGAKELAYMAKTDIPFMYSITDITKALDTNDSKAFLGWINNMVQSTTVPQLSTQVAKATDKPGSFPSNVSQRPTYRVARNPVEAVKLGIPGLRQQVPEKKRSNVSVLRR